MTITAARNCGGDVTMAAFYRHFTLGAAAAALESRSPPAPRWRVETRAMITALQHTLGPSTANWLIVVVSGVIFLAAAALLPALLRRLQGKNGHPLL